MVTRLFREMSDPRVDIEALYDEQGSALFAFVLNLTRSEADTKDILQEIFCRVAREPALLDNIRKPGAFLMKMAYRLVVDQHRRKDVRDRHVESASVTEIFAATADPDEREFRRALTEAMSALPAEQRAVLHLKLWEELTFEQIAEALEISANTAASRYRYGIDKLRDALRPIYEEIQ